MEVSDLGSETEDLNFFYDPSTLQFDLTVSDPSMFITEIRDYKAYIDLTLWNGNSWSIEWDVF